MGSSALKKQKIEVPLVSVIMANYRGERYLAASIQSVLEQSIEELELIVSDDGSDDASVEIASRAAQRDKRVRLIAGTGNTGPGATRNRALAAARGEWIAIVDSDDLMKPERLRSLIDLADARGCEIAADDLTYFGKDMENGQTLFGKSGQNLPDIISTNTFIETEIEGSKLPKLGYLKPVIRRAALNGLNYDESLRVGEDYDLLLRLLLSGARMIVTPDSYYEYRRHGSSISHRLSEAKVAAMISAHKRLAENAHDLPLETKKLLSLRLQGLEKLLAYERLVARIKQRDLTGAAQSLLARPSLTGALARSLAERLSRS